MKKTFLVIVLFGILPSIIFAQRPSFLQRDSIKSKLDQNIQTIFFDISTVSKPQPLVVELHSWSNTNLSQVEILAEQAHKKGWNYILPNFRGVNNTIKACCSDYVIEDIDEAIDWAIRNMKVDKKRIYIIGNSGGGYATLAMYMKSRHNINTFSAWSSISDLAKWYDESIERKNRYGPEILLCTGAAGKLDNQKAWDRSPLFWDTPIRKRQSSKLFIYAGIHDGYTGSVPISHSIDFYNKLLFDFKENDAGKFVSEQDSETLITTQNFIKSGIIKYLGDRKIIYQKMAKNINLIIFEGGHEILGNTALDSFSN